MNEHLDNPYVSYFFKFYVRIYYVYVPTKFLERHSVEIGISIFSA